MTQRHWEDVSVGDVIEPVVFPLTVYRLVMAAGANRDFNAIHHNAEVARATGAPDIYANTLLLQGMWERAVRQYIGLAGVIVRQSGFQMRIFNCPGDTVTVRGRVEKVWREAPASSSGLVEIEVWSENAKGVSVGPGRVRVMLPLQATPGH
jgi:acyl dehydratase